MTNYTFFVNLHKKKVKRHKKKVHALKNAKAYNCANNYDVWTCLY